MPQIVQIILTIVVFLIIAGATVFLITSVISLLLNVPYVGTSSRELEVIFGSLSLKNKSTFYDLGSGDGRVVRYVAKRFSLISVGVEANPLLYLYSIFLNLIFHSQYVHYKLARAENISFESADVIYMFLFPKLLNLLSSKIKKECKPGTIIVAHGFKVSGFDEFLYNTMPGKPFNTYYYRLNTP